MKHVLLLIAVVIGQSVLAADKARSFLATGTGFFVTADGYLLTNNHVVDGASRIIIKINGKELPAKVIKSDKLIDLAVLKVSGKFSALPIVSSRKVGLGDDVFTVGFPQIGIQGVSHKLTKGSISGLTGIRDDARSFQVSVPVQPGNSGGPLVDEYGNVVGIVVARLDAHKLLKETGSIPQNVNYAVKGTWAMAFLEALPAVASKIMDPIPRTKPRKFSDVVKEVQAATVLILVRSDSPDTATLPNTATPPITARGFGGTKRDSPKPGAIIPGLAPTGPPKPPGYKADWSTGGGRFKIDEIYPGKTESVIKQVFGDPAQKQGEYWTYRGLKVRNMKNGGTYTTVTFQIQNGKVARVIIKP